jgi:hypothetical protein
VPYIVDFRFDTTECCGARAAGRRFPTGVRVWEAQHTRPPALRPKSRGGMSAWRNAHPGPAKAALSLGEPITGAPVSHLVSRCAVAPGASAASHAWALPQASAASHARALPHASALTHADLTEMLGFLHDVCDITAHLQNPAAPSRERLRNSALAQRDNIRGPFALCLSNATRVTPDYCTSS